MAAFEGTGYCKNCGAPKEAAACPFCGADAEGALPPTAAKIILRGCGKALTVWLGFVVLFALFGLAAAWGTGDWNSLVALTIFGVVLGFLFGVGSLVIDAAAKWQGREPHTPTPEETSRSLADLAFGTLGPWAKLLAFGVSAARWARTTNFRAASRGRWRRACIGAACLGGFSALLLIAAIEVLPAHQNRLPLLAAVTWILVAGAIGAVLGALSDAL